MTLWSARNGYLGTGAVACLVEAETEQEARRLVVAAFRAEEEGSGYPAGIREDYWQIASIRRVALPYVGDELP